ncbi:MAG: TetR/AcrR family transcriptional regulator [Geodermatophilaceae bacterium]|nr:TetR/AcrR family transcriptional regulator [Geodermatophilaceae bacterium]
MSRGLGVNSSLTRREVNRETNLVDIRQRARELLVAEGPAGVTLRPIARAIGLTAPALYRYYASREDLLLDLIADLYDELTTSMERARDELARDDLTGRFIVVTRAFRRWARAHPREFELVFATPVGDPGAPKDDRLEGCGQRFGGVFQGLFVELWMHQQFPVVADEQLDPRLRRQLRQWAADNDIPLPLGALDVFLTCWVRLYGLISLEVFGHLSFALTDVEPMFDAMLSELAQRLGLSWRAEFSAG